MLLDVDSAAKSLSVATSTLRKWIATGRLPVVRLGRRVLLRPETLDEFINDAEGHREERGGVAHER